MHSLVSWLSTVIAVVVFGGGLGTASAFGSSVPVASTWHLRWSSPHVIRTGEQAAFASIDPCPKRRPDGSRIQGQREVFVSIAFAGGGAKIIGPIAVHKDGSWTARITPNIGSTVHDPTATIGASCNDVAHGTSVPIGSYTVHNVAVNP